MFDVYVKEILVFLLFGCGKVHFGLEMKTVEIDSVYFFYLKDFEGVYSRLLDSFTQVWKLSSLLDLFLKTFWIKIS